LFSSLRTQVKLKSSEAYKNYINNISDGFISDPKSFWRYVNSKRRTTRLPGVMFLNGENISDPQSIVNSFADFFASFYLPSSARSLHESSYVSFPSTSVKSVNLDEVVQAMKHLKGNLTSGIDQIPSFLVKDCAQFLAPAIHKIINLMLRDGVFPDMEIC